MTSANKAATGYTVWAEDSDTGRVLAATSTSFDGSFRFGGLSFGRITLYAQGPDGENSVAGSPIGDFSVSAKPPAPFTRRVEKTSSDLHPDFLGFNGILAEIAVSLNAGNSYFVLIGSGGEIDEPMSVGSTSDLIGIQAKTYPGYFSNRIKTVGFDVSIAANTPVGEYSLFVRSSSGEKRFIIGGLTVEKFANFWTSTLTK